MRPSKRAFDELRPIILTPNASRYAEGSCIAAFGHTRVLCTASVSDDTPRFLKNTGKGWVTAEYGMLPRATHTRMDREAARGKQSGRTQEIQRLIGRSLRAIVDLKTLGERQITIDCDVLEADGGTRTAAITGAYVALNLAIKKLISTGQLNKNPITGQVAAISCGIYHGQPVLDLDYDEDSNCTMDANFVLTADGKIIEMQCTAEEHPVTDEQFQALFTLARAGIADLAQHQQQALG